MQRRVFAQRHVKVITDLMEAQRHVEVITEVLGVRLVSWAALSFLF